MAKRKGRRKFRKYLKGMIDTAFGLGTLSASTLIGANAPDSVTEKAWLSSVKAIWTMDDFTPTADRGPIVVGVAHSDYTDAEIEAWVENLGSWEQGDKVQQEIARRYIRRVGAFASPHGGSALDIAVLNDGRPIHTKCGWQLSTGQTVRLWAYNAGSGDLATTAPNIHVQGHANLWPN